MASALRGEKHLPLDMCELRSLTHRLQLLRYANKPLSVKDCETGIFDCFLCAEPWGDSYGELLEAC